MTTVTTPEARNRSRKLLVMTGGSSGFGRRMLERLLAERPDFRVALIARPSSRVTDLMTLPGASERLTVVEADLASLTSVARAGAIVRAWAEAEQIEALAFNAGLQAVLGDQASEDGFELSFAVNHLAHFLLCERLVPLMRPGGRVVMTSSVVHDADAFCLVGITRGVWEDPLVLSDPARAQSQLTERVDRGEARYCVSKLLNLMVARHLAQAHPGIVSFGFNPNVVPGTDIARERNMLQILAWKYLLPVLAPVLPGARSLEQSAGDLLWLVTGEQARAFSGAYVDGRVVQPGSELSRDREKIARLVEVSRALITERLGADAGSDTGAEPSASPPVAPAATAA